MPMDLLIKLILPAGMVLLSGGLVFLTAFYAVVTARPPLQWRRYSLTCRIWGHRWREGRCVCCGRMRPSEEVSYRREDVKNDGPVTAMHSQKREKGVSCLKRAAWMNCRAGCCCGVFFRRHYSFRRSDSNKWNVSAVSAKIVIDRTKRQNDYVIHDRPLQLERRFVKMDIERKAVKKHGKKVLAWRLGDGSAMEKDLIDKGLIRVLPDGKYELFSLESQSGSGQIAEKGWYFKVDSNGNPYPNREDFFVSHHLHLEGDSYEQIPSPVVYWEKGLPMPETVRYLFDSGKVRVNENDPDRYFTTFLWGAPLSTGVDGKIVIYSVQKGEDGSITDIDYAFISADEFALTYDIL